MSFFSCLCGHKAQHLADLSDSIENNLAQCARLDKNTVHCLLLGPGDAGKTTIVKQMKQIYAVVDANDLKMACPLIKKGVVEYIQKLCKKAQEFQLDGEPTAIQEENESLCQEILNLASPELTPKVADMIAKMWTDNGIKETLRLRHKFQIQDNVAYFLDRVQTIAKEDYVPTFDDYVRLRNKTTGINTESFTTQLPQWGQYHFEFTDVGGQRSERHKWRTMMNDHMQAILFVVGLSEYDMKCHEDNTTNRLTEAFTVFQEQVESGFFKKKSVILFLNKYDLFQEKIKQVPITVAMPDFPAELNPNDEGDVSNFIIGKFQKMFAKVDKKQGAHLHAHRTSALDTNNIKHVICDVTQDLVTKKMRGSGL